MSIFKTKPGEFLLFEDFGVERKMRNFTMILFDTDKNALKSVGPNIMVNDLPNINRNEAYPILFFWRNESPTTVYKTRIRLYGGYYSDQSKAIYEILYCYDRDRTKKEFYKLLYSDLKKDIILEKRQFTKDKFINKKARLAKKLLEENEALTEEEALANAAAKLVFDSESAKAVEKTKAIMSFMPHLIELKDTIETSIRLYSNGAPIKYADKKKKKIRDLIRTLKADQK